MIPPKNKNVFNLSNALSQSFDAGSDVDTQEPDKSTQTTPQSKSNGFDLSKALTQSFQPEKKNGGDESNSNPQSSSQNNSGVPMVGNPDFQEPTNFTTGNNVFPTDSKSMLNIPLGNTANNHGVSQSNNGNDNKIFSTVNNPLPFVQKQPTIITPDGGVLTIKNKPAFVNQADDLNSIQQRVLSNTATNQDIYTLAQATGKSVAATSAYLTQGTKMGASIENNENVTNTINNISGFIQRYNQAYGTSYDPKQVLSSSKSAFDFFNVAKNSTLQTAKTLDFSKPLDSQDKNKFALNFGMEPINNELLNQVIQKVVQEQPDKNAAINNIAQKLNPVDYAKTQKAANSDNSIVANLTNSDDEDNDLFNYQKGIAEIKYNDALKQNAINKISQGNISNDQNLVKEGQSDLNRVDDDVISKYPSLMKQQIAQRVNDLIAKESGVVEGSDTESGHRLERIFGTSTQDRINAMQKLGYLDNPKTKDLALSMAPNSTYFANNSILGGIVPSFLQPFGELGMSLADITGLRNNKDIYADKLKDQIFQKDFAGNNPDDPNVLHLKKDVSVSRNILNTSANLAGMLAIASATEGAGTEVGLSTKAATQLGAYTSFGLPSFDASLKDSKSFINNEPAQYLYAAINSVANAEGGKLLDLGKITRLPVSEEFAKIANGFSNNSITESATKELLNSAKDKYVNFAVKYGKNVTKGAATMAYFNTANNIIKIGFGDDQAKDDILPQAGHAFLDGLLGMSIMGGFGAVADMKNEKNTSFKSNIYNLALNHDAAADVFKQGLLDGTYTKSEYHQKMQILNTAVAAKNALDATQAETNVNLTQDQKSVYVANKTAQAVLESKANQEGIPDETKNMYLSQAKRLSEQSVQTLDGLKFTPTLEPLYDLYNAEKNYNAALENYNPADKKSSDDLEAAKDNYDKLYSSYLENNSSQSQTNTNGKSKESVPENVNETIRGEQTGQQSGQENVDQNQQQKEEVGTEGAGKKTAPLSEPTEVSDAEILPTFDKVKEFIPEENLDETQNVITKINNADNVNVDDLSKAEDNLYTALDKAPEASHLIEPLILKIQNYPDEFKTKTETDTATEKVPIEGSFESKSKPKIGSALEQSTDSPISITGSDGTTTNGTLKVKDGNYVVDKGDDSEPIVIGEKAATDVNLKLPDEETVPEPIQFDENQNVKSVTVQTGKGDLIKINDPEKALDIAIQLQANSVGEIPDAAFDKAYETVSKEVKKEVPIVNGKENNPLKDVENTTNAIRDLSDEDYNKLYKSFPSSRNEEDIANVYHKIIKKSESERTEDQYKKVKAVEDAIGNKNKNNAKPSNDNKSADIPIPDRTVLPTVGGSESGNKATTQTENKVESKTNSTDKTVPINEIKKDLGQRAREEAAKFRSGKKSILPDFLKAKLPEGTTKSGIDLDTAWAKALETFADVHDATKDFAKAIDAGYQHLKDWFDDNKIPYTEKDLKDGFKNEMSENKTEDNSGQKPPPETPKNENEGKEENEGIGISKAALNESHGFKRVFESKSAKEVADNIFSELQSEAKDKGIKVNQHIANEVDDMAAQGSKLAPTEYNIITAGTHSMNIDRQIDEAQAKGESVESLIKERDKTDAVLRQLGNNAGRNLGLFNLVFNDITDSGINVARRNLSKVLGIEDTPQTLEDLKNSDLSSFDKKRAYPYVERIEKLIKERDDYEKKSIQNISKINDEEVQKAIKDAYDKGKKEGASRGTDKPAKEKKSQQLKDMASLLRRSDEMDKFLKGNNDITKAGFDLGSYKEVIANILDGVAKIVETGENISDYLKKAIENVKGFDKDKLLSDIQTIMARSSMPKREDVIADINKIAENESATSITRSMVDKGLIKNVVDDIALSGTPSEKVIDESTEELKKHLPNVTRDDVADAYVKRNEFAPETKNKLKNTVVEKQQEIKRLSVKEARLEALEKADDFHAAETKEDKSKIKSEYEKNLDKRISDLKKQKSDAIAANKKSAKEQKKIDDINDEINHVNNTKSVFERAIKSPKQASEDLKAARLERDKTYEKNGLRIQRNERQPIKVEREYQKNVDKINSDDSLSKEEKNNKLDELKQQRDLDLRGTKQGVLSHLSDELNDLKNQNIQDANDATDEHASQLRDINSKIDNILKGIKPTGENLDDLTNKAYDKLGKLLDDKTVPDDIKEHIRTITKNLEDNAQLTANELAAKTLKNRWQKDIDRANTKLNSGNFTELPITPFDFRRNNELAVLNRKRETTQKGVNNLIREAYDKKRTKADRLMDLSSKLLISGVHTVTKVAEAGALKPVMDSIVEATTGRIFNKLTDTPEVTFKEIKRGFKTLAAFKNKESANRYIEKLKGVKETSLGNLQKAYEGGNKNEISKAEIAFKKADLSYAISTLYESIDANSLKSFWEYMAHGATDLDAEMGKGLRKSINDYHTKLEKAGYVLEGWIRTHGALKASLSARNEMMRSYASTLKWMQKKGMPLNEENLALAHVIAQNDFEYGRLSNSTEFSKTVSEFKNSDKLGVRLAARTLFPVSTIAINIAKRGIDYSSLGAEGWGKLARGVREGMQLNETEGKTYDTFVGKIKDAIQQIPLQERKYINGVISRGLFGATLGAVTLWGLANGKIKYGGTWDDRKKRKIIGSDGQVLQPNEWEFFGWKAPKMMDAFINHVPEFLPIALTSDYYQINTLDKDGVGVNFFDTAMGEIEDRMPFMTLANIFNQPTSTLEDRFTRVPIAQDVEKEFDSKKRANKSFSEKLKNNVGLGFLNPEKEDMPSNFPDAIKKDYDRTTDKGFLPPKIEARIIYKGHQIDLNNKQYQDFSKMVNDERATSAKAITDDPDYNKASDEQRKKMLKSGYEYSKKVAKYQFLNKYPGLKSSVEQKISNEAKESAQQIEARGQGGGASKSY